MYFQSIYDATFTKGFFLLHEIYRSTQNSALTAHTKPVDNQIPQTQNHDKTNADAAGLCHA